MPLPPAAIASTLVPAREKLTCPEPPPNAPRVRARMKTWKILHDYPATATTATGAAAHAYMHNLAYS